MSLAVILFKINALETALNSSDLTPEESNQFVSLYYKTIQDISNYRSSSSQDRFEFKESQKSLKQRVQKLDFLVQKIKTDEDFRVFSQDLSDLEGYLSNESESPQDFTLIASMYSKLRSFCEAHCSEGSFSERLDRVKVIIISSFEKKIKQWELEISNCKDLEDLNVLFDKYDEIKINSIFKKFRNNELKNGVCDFINKLNFKYAIYKWADFLPLLRQNKDLRVSADQYQKWEKNYAHMKSEILGNQIYIDQSFLEEKLSEMEEAEELLQYIKTNIS